MRQVPAGDHWNEIARQWNRLGPPLRPCPEDVTLMRGNLLPNTGRSLLLGVTPELATLSVPLIAVDHNAAMIDALWPGNQPDRQALQGDWLQLPLPEHVFDAVLGDGCMTLLSHPSQYRRFFDEMGRVLKPGGRMLLRLFVNAEESETCDELCQEALHGRIRGFHAFKWRLSMAVAAEAGDPNMCVAETYRIFQSLFPDRESLAKTTGWNLDEIATIDFYRKSAARYSYPSLSKVRELIPRGFREIGLLQGSYELAERCPLLILESVD